MLERLLCFLRGRHSWYIVESTNKFAKWFEFCPNCMYTKHTVTTGTLYIKVRKSKKEVVEWIWRKQ